MSDADGRAVSAAVPALEPDAPTSDAQAADNRAPGPTAFPEPAAEDHAARGDVIAGRYVLGSVIGVGSSSVVHRARDLHGDALVAVKRFRDGGSEIERRQQRQELSVLTGIGAHPHLVGLRDGGHGADGDSGPFVVTDLVEGPTLAERIKVGPPLGPHAVRSLGARLADALAHVHAAGFVHRDVKPANVLLGFHGRPQLADFGIAVPVGAPLRTEEGCVIGTAAYLAPEQVRGQRVGPPADVYALGLVLLEALTRRREYPGGAVESATARLHRDPVVPDDLPGGLDAVLIAMTAADPAARPSAAQVSAALTVDAAEVTPRSPRVGRHRLAGRVLRRHPVGRLAAAGLLVAAMAAGITMLVAPGGPAPVSAEVQSSESVTTPPR